MAKESKIIRTLEEQKNQIKKNISSLNNDLIGISEEIIETTVKIGTKWQKFIAKSIKTSEPVVEKQVDVVFDTLNTLKLQWKDGKKQWKKLRTSGTSKVEAAEKTAVHGILKSSTPVKSAVVVVQKTAKKSTPVKSEKTAIKKVSKKSTVVKSEKATVNKIAKSKATVKAEKISAVSSKEDLTIIEGIGPKIEELLNAAGILTFNDLATAQYNTIQGILDAAGSRFKMHDPSFWMTQASYAAKGQMTELDAWKATHTPATTKAN